MRIISLLVAGVLAPALLLVATLGQADFAYASFHCMRIHAVMGGLNGNNTIQYVELRMDAPAQEFVAFQPLQFFDAAGVLKATFTFPANVTNASTGDSILIATSEFNGAAMGGTPDFTFSNANTAASNGGDPLHPVQSPGGKVVWLPAGPTCTVRPVPADSVAYGGATADFGTAAVALPNPGTNNALRLNNLNTVPMNNSTEYALNPVSGSTFMVAPANLPSDLTTPRNNGRVVLKLPVAPSVGGVAIEPDLPARAVAATSAAGGRSYVVPEIAAAGVALLAAACAAWYARRRRNVHV